MKFSIKIITPKIVTIFFMFLAMLAMNSCIGASADITIRADGSGSIALEYRLPMMLESIGKLDGNERWPVIPVGRADFERGLPRIPGLRLRTFSSREVNAAQGGKDLLTRAVLDFDDTAALLAFLDVTGSHASLSQGSQGNLLRLALLDPSPQTVNADLVSLMQEVCEGYDLQISLSAPRDASLAVIPSVQGARVVSQGRKVSFAIGIGDLLSLSEGLALEIRW